MADKIDDGGAAPRFENVSCSQCGEDFGPGDSGFSHCDQHRPQLPFPADWRMKETAHYNGGEQWFGYGSQCIQEPRLSAIDRYYRKDRSVVRTWEVDGRASENADAAWAALQMPPEFTDDEIAALRLVPAEPADLRKAMPYQTFYFLRAKGAVLGGMRDCCISDTGRAAMIRARATQKRDDE